MKNLHFFAWILMGCGGLIGPAFQIKAQNTKNFQAVALHLAPGNLAVMEFKGTPVSKGTVLIELPPGLTPDRVYCSPASANGLISGAQHQQNPATPASGTPAPASGAEGSSSVSSNGSSPRLIVQTLRDSVRRQQAAADFASLITINAGRSVSVETFDGSENIGYRGTIVGIDPKGEVLVLADGQDIHNIPVRQIMYWSAGSDWKNTQEYKEPSRYCVRLMAPDGWNDGSIRLWVETKNVDCGYSYRLRKSSQNRMALDLRLQTSFAFDKVDLVGHPSLNFHSLDESSSPIFRTSAPEGSEAGLFSTTVREDEVSLLLKEEWTLGAVSVVDSHFLQKPEIRTSLSVKAPKGDRGFLSIPVYMESENQPPILMHPTHPQPSDSELQFQLAKSVLIGADSGKISRGRQLAEGIKPVGPEGWRVDGRIEADYLGTTPVEWTVRRSFLPEDSGSKNQKFTVLDCKNPNAVLREFTQTVRIHSENRYALTYTYFLAPLQRGRK